MLLRPGWRRPLANFPHFNLGQPFDSAMMCLAMFCGSSKFGGLVVTEVNPDHDAVARAVDFRHRAAVADVRWP
jgi:hypothetical protein